jgi:hypothetical protein
MEMSATITASIVAITASRRDRAGTAISVLLAVGLIALAGPRLAGEIRRQLHLANVERAEAGETLAPGTLERTAIALERIGAEGRIARASGDSARAWAVLASDPAQAAFARANLEATRRNVTRALVEAPGDSFAWQRLAFATANTGRLGDAGRAVAMSVRTGLFDLNIMNPRSRAMLFLWPHLDETDRLQAGIQFLRHWQWEPGGIVGMAYFENAIPSALAAAAPHTALRRDFEIRFARIRAELGETPPRR